MKNSNVVIKLYIKANQANPSPPIGPILGQRGINISSFCNQFNNETKNNNSSLPLTVIITIKPNKSFSFIIKEPPVSKLVLKYSSLNKGSDKPGIKIIGSIKMSNVIEITKIKNKETNKKNFLAMKKMVVGTIKSMGIKII